MAQEEPLTAQAPSVPSVSIPEGPTPFSRGTLQAVAVHSNGRECPSTEDLACHLQRCSRLTTCQWMWSTAWPQTAHPVAGTTA